MDDCLGKKEKGVIVPISSGFALVKHYAMSFEYLMK